MKNLALSKYFGQISLLLIVFLISCQEFVVEQLAEEEPVVFQDNIFGDYVPDSYIVILNPSQVNFRISDKYEDAQLAIRSESMKVLNQYHVPIENLKKVYSRTFQGFAAKLSSEELSALAKDKSIQRIVRDKYFYADFQKGKEPGKGKPGGQDPVTDPEPEPEPVEIPWGLDRIDQRGQFLNRSFQTPNAGQGVNIYIMDTGILTTHEEFQGRASLGYDAYGELSEDCNGHGTHVAGTVAGAFYGVAKQANLISVKVLGIPHVDYPCNGAGTLEGVLGGLDWIASNAQAPAIVNMSLGGLNDDLLNDAVNQLVNMGIPVIVSAGNSGDDSCQFSPASASGSFAVGASNMWDQKTSFSSSGPCVDIFAPGEWIQSAFVDSNTATATLHGTSMAAPHVTGVAALILNQNPGFNSQQVYDMLKATSTKHLVENSATKNNHLLFSGLNSDGAGEIDPSWDPTLIHLDAWKEGSGKNVRVTYAWAGIYFYDNVDIYVDGQIIDTVTERNLYQVIVENANRINSKRYKVCNQRTGECSNEVTINF